MVGAVVFAPPKGRVALYEQLRGTDYFLYPLANRHGVVHKDTFATVVLDALVNGVVVVLPPYFALGDWWRPVAATVELEGNRGAVMTVTGINAGPQPESTFALIDEAAPW